MSLIQVCHHQQFHEILPWQYPLTQAHEHTSNSKISVLVLVYVQQVAAPLN